MPEGFSEKNRKHLQRIPNFRATRNVAKWRKLNRRGYGRLRVPPSSKLEKAYDNGPAGHANSFLCWRCAVSRFWCSWVETKKQTMPMTHVRESSEVSEQSNQVPSSDRPERTSQPSANAEQQLPLRLLRTTTVRHYC